MATCPWCGVEFEPNRRPDKNWVQRYCSRDCGRKGQSRRVTLTCVQCGQDFQRKRYMAKWSQERGPFCGFRCYGQWQSENATGPNNPNFLPESPRRGAGQWERNRKAALERDHYRCRKCGSTHRLHVHHREPWAEGQDSPHELDNLETLCASCHRKAHPIPHGPDGRFVRAN